MAALNELIQRIENPELREQIQAAADRLAKQKKFGLVFEEHLPECTPLYGIPVRKGAKVALKTGRVNEFYDRYTRYRRDNAIQVECLPYSQFMKQLRKSDLFVENKMIRFGDDTKRCVVLNYAVMQKKCDVDGFLHSYAAPLTGGRGE